MEAGNEQGSGRAAALGAGGIPPLATALWFVGAAAFLLFVALEPLLGFALFGSDTGEYYRLTSALATTGHLPIGAAYGGWGQFYPDFPGIFLVAAGSAGALGVGPLGALSVVLPALGALAFAPLFLLFRRMFPHDAIALAGAALGSVAMPRMFSVAHPAPLALGDFFVVAALWMFVEGRRDRRWYLPLALTVAALVVTHHLSTYLFVVSAVGGLLLLELWRPGSWSARFPTRELALGFAAVAGALVYWLEYAPDFRAIVVQGVPSALALPGAGLLGLLVAAAAIAFGLAGLLIRWRRRRARPRGFVRLPGDASVVRDLVVIGAIIFVGIGLLVVLPLPGTTQRTTLGAVAFFAPVLLLAPLASGSRRLLTMSRLGPFALTWLAALGLSALFGIVTNSPVILPARHAEYLLIPAGFLVAVVAGWVIARAGDRYGRRALAAGGVALVLLVGANAAIVYPPPADFGGFQEGLTWPDAALWAWVGIAVPPGAVVASDHRLSSMVFGFDGTRATWDSTPELFTGSNWSLASLELAGSYAPHTSRAVEVVAIDATMHSGVALDPSAPALPLSPSALLWFAAPPFLPLYENGEQAVYWVASGPGP